MLISNYHFLECSRMQRNPRPTILPFFRSGISHFFETETLCFKSRFSQALHRQKDEAIYAIRYHILFARGPLLHNNIL